MSSDALSTVKMHAFAPSGAEQAFGRLPETAPVQVATSKQAPKDEPAVPPTAEAIKAAAAQIDSYLKSTNRELDIRVDSETGRTIVSVRDKATGDLIRQIPGEEVLRMARTLKAGSAALVDLTV